MISIGAKGTGNSRILLPLSVRHRLQPMTYIAFDEKMGVLEFLGTVKP